MGFMASLGAPIAEKSMGDSWGSCEVLYYNWFRYILWIVGNTIYMDNWLRYILRVIRLSARCHGQVSWIRFTWGDGHAPSGPL